jgi:hypothetical protein
VAGVRRGLWVLWLEGGASDMYVGLARIVYIHRI